MADRTNNPRPMSAKVIISGGFGAGKTSFVASVSEIKPVRTEAAMTDQGQAVDDRTLVGAKTTTTVAMDFGKVTADAGLILYLFGTPGQDRFSFMWDDVCKGALGALVLVDSRRLEQSYAAVDYFEARNVPFVVALNQFEGAPVHDRGEIREALSIHATTPIFTFDARNQRSARHALVALLEHLLAVYRARRQAAGPYPGSVRQNSMAKALRMPGRAEITRESSAVGTQLSRADAQKVLGVLGRSQQGD